MDARLDARVLRRGPSGGSAPAIYVIDAPEHPFDLAPLVGDLSSTVVSVPVRNWGDALTPWPAAALYRGEPDYGGGAPQTLERLLSELVPGVEAAEGLCPRARAICGYSLGGLFALHAFTHTDAFRACACLSGSVWYEGWVEHLASLDLNLEGRFAFLSLGTKEKRGARPLMRTVEDRMGACAEILRKHGCTVHYELGPGNHFQHIDERYAAGLAALDTFLSSCQEGYSAV